MDPPNILSCAGDKNHSPEEDAFQFPKSPGEHMFCQKCLQSKDAWSPNEFHAKSAKPTNYAKTGLIAKNSNPYKNQKIIINTNINFPKKAEAEAFKESFPQNESFSLSVVYQNFEDQASRFFSFFLCGIVN